MLSVTHTHCIPASNSQRNVSSQRNRFQTSNPAVFGNRWSKDCPQTTDSLTNILIQRGVTAVMAAAPLPWRFLTVKEKPNMFFFRHLDSSVCLSLTRVRSVNTGRPLSCRYQVIYLHSTTFVHSSKWETTDSGLFVFTVCLIFLGIFLLSRFSQVSEQKKKSDFFFFCHCCLIPFKPGMTLLSATFRLRSTQNKLIFIFQQPRRHRTEQSCLLEAKLNHTVTQVWRHFIGSSSGDLVKGDFLGFQISCRAKLIFRLPATAWI